MNYWYRYEDVRYAAPVDEWDNISGECSVGVHRRKFSVIKETPKGVWLDNYGMKRFVLREARKRFACPTDEEAQISFLARKAKQIRILRGQIYNVERAIAALPDAVKF